MAERLAWPLLVLLGITLAIAEWDIPEQAMSCSEASEEFCKSTSLLQLSLVRTKPSHTGQDKLPRIITAAFTRTPQQEPEEFQLYMMHPLIMNVLSTFLILCVIVLLLWACLGTKDTSWVGVMKVMHGLSFSLLILGCFLNNGTWHIEAKLSTGSMTTMPAHWHQWFCMIGEAKICTTYPYHTIKTMMSMDGAIRITGVLLFTIVVGVPLLTTLLLVLGEEYRYKESSVGRARKCLIAARYVAKWTSPLYFFTLIYHCQLLAIQEPGVLETTTALDIGWLCCTVSALTNAIVALSIPIPPLPPDQHWLCHCPISRGCKMFVFLLTLANAVVYSILLLIGCMKPLFSLNLDMYQYYTSGLDSEATAAMNTTLSLFGCLWLMMQRFYFSLQAIPLFAFAVLLGGAIILPIVDMFSMTLCLLHLQRNDDSGFSYWLCVSRVTRHCVLVDAFLVGALLAQISSFVNLKDGLILLLAAELLRYLTIYFMIEAVAAHNDLTYLHVSRQWETRHKLMTQTPVRTAEDEQPAEEQPPFGSAEQHLRDGQSQIPSKGVIRMEKAIEHMRAGRKPAGFSDADTWEVEAARGVQLQIA